MSNEQDKGAGVELEKVEFIGPITGATHWTPYEPAAALIASQQAEIAKVKHQRQVFEDQLNDHIGKLKQAQATIERQARELADEKETNAVLDAGIDKFEARVKEMAGLLSAAQSQQAEIERLTRELAEAQAALRELYRWYDTDGSVGGASQVFDDHREAALASSRGAD